MAIIDVVEARREWAGGLMEVCLSSVANRQNEVIKVLTIMASVFVPLTFWAGVYGMNFESMPELRSPRVYALLLIILVTVGVGMTVCFKKERWLGGQRNRRVSIRSCGN